MGLSSRRRRGDIGAALHESVYVAFTPGGIPGVRTEWAVVLLWERPYVVTVMEKFEMKNEGVSALTQISGILFDYF